MITIKNIFIKPSILVSIFVALVVLILSSAYYELKQSKDEMLHLMAEQAHSLLQSIVVSSQEVLFASGEVEAEMRDRLLNNANIIKILFDKNLVSNSILTKIAEENKLNRIHIFKKDGTKLFTSNTETSRYSISKQKVIETLNPIFNDKLDTLIVGFKNSNANLGMRYVVAIASNNNSAIVLNLDAEELLAFKRRIGFGILIKRLTEDREVQYAILENQSGILAASGNIDDVKTITEIDSSSWVQADSTYNWRIAEYGSREVFEARHPLYLEGDLLGYYRIGINTEPLNKINDRLQRRIIISGIFLFVFGFMMIILLFVRQNLDIVKKQYQKIETYSKKLIESVSDAIVVIDSDKNILEANKSAEKLFNKELLGENLDVVFGKECVDAVSNNDAITQLECELGNQTKELLISKSKFIDEKENENIVFILKDLTELKKLERQITRNERMNAMGQLASGVAHEIRNPLNSIATIVQQLDKDFEPVDNAEEYHTLAGIVAKEVKRMNGTIENFLRFSRPEPIRKSEFVLSELINSIETQFQSYTKEKGIEFEVKQNWDGNVQWDRNQIKQVLINLIKNSMEAIIDGGKIMIEIYSQKKNVIISVVDNGEGISEENLQRIFNLYFTSKAKGTGIGLSVIQRIINEHGGMIDVESEVGKGAVFTLTIPIN